MTTPLLLPVFRVAKLRAWPKHPQGGAAGYQLAAAGRAAEKASLDLGWYAERSATGIDLLRRQVAA